MMCNVSDIQTALTPVFLDYGISRAVLFGSVAKGTATDKSDLDLLVDSKHETGGSLCVQSQSAGRTVPCCGRFLCSGSSRNSLEGDLRPAKSYRPRL